MASSAFVPQLLINEGELDEIVRIIGAAKSSESKVVGKLFGLWRNSLIQPVVQLVTGPGGRAKTSKKHFESDDRYHHKIKKFLECEHGLLQIGLWFSGNVDRYPRFNQAGRDYGRIHPLIPKEGRYVFMSVDCSRETPEIEYQVIDRERNSYQVARLTNADVLSGESGFRLVQRITDKINQRAKFPPRPNEQRPKFSTVMLETNHDERPANIVQSNTGTRAKHASFMPASTLTHSSQWYESDGGSSLLRRLVNKFESQGVSVDMSRDSKSHDIQLIINRTICLHFPADFPTAPMSLTWLNDSLRFTKNPNEICTMVAGRALDVLSYETACRMSRTTRL